MTSNGNYSQVKMISKQHQDLQKENKQIRSNYQVQASLSVEKKKKYDYLNKYSQHMILQDASRHHLSQAPQNQSFDSENLARHPRSISNSSLSPQLRMQAQKDEKSPKAVLMRAYNESMSPKIGITSKSSEKGKQRFRGGKYQMKSHQNSPRSQNYLTQATCALSSIPSSLAKGFVSELTIQNDILRSQLNEYRVKVERLQNECQKKENKINFLIQESKKRQLLHQESTDQLKNQAIMWKTRYEVLNQQLYQNQLKRTMEQQNNFYDRQSLAKKIIEQIQSIVLPEKKLEIFQSRCMDYQVEKIYQVIKNEMKRKDILQKLVFNISQMHRKVQKCNQLNDDSNQLKSLWKWLKKIGALQSSVNELMPILSEKLGIRSNLQPVQFMQSIARKILQKSS